MLNNLKEEYWIQLNVFYYPSQQESLDASNLSTKLLEVGV